ncbi:hypothetical protein [Nesterenkonia pannonica]|uniref:hypothetical protein n=1 Tax=Nesterenkonia pannonica TaxID=1548602 RepID=UPI0021640699|nr:hypothetical protein [Nesterenkonia pannonica]
MEAESSARWGYPTGGTSVLPFVISWCELDGGSDGITVLRDPETNAVTGVDIPSSTPERVIKRADFDEELDADCEDPFGGAQSGEDQKLPGGFGWVDTSGQCGENTSAIGGGSDLTPATTSLQ